MGKMMIRILILFFSLQFSLYGSGVPNFEDISRSENVIFFLSTPRSGSNLITGCLTIIARKPVSWLQWGKDVFDPLSPYRTHPSYNRLNLSLLSHIPILYRAHDAAKLNGVISKKNKLIFATRNPKELLFRAFYLTSSPPKTPSKAFIKKFTSGYLKNFRAFNLWDPKNRYLIFYEDFINHETLELSKILRFMGEETPYIEDFKANKEEYLKRLFESYQMQHNLVNGGASSLQGPRAIHYTKNVPRNVLKSVDMALIKAAPLIWKKYLRRFRTL